MLFLEIQCVSGVPAEGFSHIHSEIQFRPSFSVIFYENRPRKPGYFLKKTVSKPEKMLYNKTVSLYMQARSGFIHSRLASASMRKEQNQAHQPPELTRFMEEFGI